MVKKNVDYFELLKQSWKQLRNNLVLLLPILVYIGFGIAFVLLLGLEAIISASIGEISSSLTILIITISIFAIIDIIILMISSSFIKSMFLGGFYEVSKKRKTSFQNMLGYGKKLWKKIFMIGLIKIIIIILPPLILTTIALSFFLISQTTGIIISIILGIIATLYVSIMIIIFFFGLFFIGPKIITENLTALDLIKSSFTYTKENLLHVIITWAIMLLVGLIFGVGSFIIQFPIMIGQAIILESSITPLIAIIFMIRFGIGAIITIIRILMQLTLQLFVFNSYFAKK